MEKTMKHESGYLSLAQVAKKMKISRIAVFKKVKKGDIKAERIGKAYAVAEDDIIYLLAEDKTNYGNDKGEITIYNSKEGPGLEVRLLDKTVWLTQKQMAALFEKGIPTINEHIKNIFQEGELKEKAVIRYFRITAVDGKNYETAFYNLDVIISVGYRVKSNTGTQFRMWATKILSEHILKGYTINEKRLLQEKQRFIELQKAITFFKDKSKIGLIKESGVDLFSLLEEYSAAIRLLSDYDEGRLKIPAGQKSGFILSYDDVIDIAGKARKELVRRGEAGSLFGRELGDRLRSIVGAIYQTFDGKELYPTAGEKAANLLYFIIKDHPFSDGNKRLGSLLFVYFLEKSGIMRHGGGDKKINDAALAALALLIAVSDPKDKGVMIGITANILK
jgi:prophage maintenance system killer protein